jgi:hypothetical protein
MIIFDELISFILGMRIFIAIFDYFQANFSPVDNLLSLFSQINTVIVRIKGKMFLAF